MRNSAFCLDSEPEIQKILYHDFKKLVCIKFVVCLLSVVSDYFFLCSLCFTMFRENCLKQWFVLPDSVLKLFLQY